MGHEEKVGLSSKQSTDLSNLRFKWHLGRVSEKNVVFALYMFMEKLLAKMFFLGKFLILHYFLTHWKLFGPPSKYFQGVWHFCFPPKHRDNFRALLFFFRKERFFIFCFRFLERTVRLLSNNFFGVLSKVHSTCPSEHWEECFLCRFLFITFWDMEIKFFGFYRILYWQACQSCSPRVHGNNFRLINFTKNFKIS